MNQRLLLSALLGGMALCLASTAWSQDPFGSNPPAFQTLGMVDTTAPHLVEADCRACHDAGVPDRHHLLYVTPIPAGSLVPYPDTDGDGFPETTYNCISCHGDPLTVERDCLVCHNTGSPHHTTQDAFDRHCTACHGDLVDNYDDGHYIPTYLASLVTPYRGLDGDGYENWPWPTPDLVSDGSGPVVPADATVTEEGPPFFTVTYIGPLGALHTRSAPNDLSFKPAGDNNDFVIRSTHHRNATFSVVFTTGSPLGASWDVGTQTLSVTLDTAQTASDLVNAINAATGAVDVAAELGWDGDDPVVDLLPPESYEPLGGDPPNGRNFRAGSCSYCHDNEGELDANGQPAGFIWDNRTLHHEIGLPSQVNDGAGGTWSRCNICHDVATTGEQSGPSFDLAIRVCQECHGPDSLHNIQADSPNAGSLYTIVIGGEDAGYGHVGRDAGAGDSDCWGCHGFGAEFVGGLKIGPVIPTLHASDLAVVRAGRETAVVLQGAAFTNEADGATYESDVRLTAADGSSVTLIPEIVNQGLMSVTIPADLAPGNYNVQAVKEELASKPIVISVNPRVIITNARANGRTVQIIGSGFGGYAEGSGTSVTARVTTARGKNEAARIAEGEVVSWSDTTIVVKFAARPREVTVNSVYGSATSKVGGRGRPPRKVSE